MFEIGFPYAFFLLLLPIFSLWIRKARACRQMQGLPVPFYVRLRAAMVDTPQRLSSGYAIPLLIIWCLFTTGLSDPRWVGTPIPISQTGRHLMMALDISGSMGLDDMVAQGRPVTRLALVKQAASQFVAQRMEDKIGLMVFGTYVYLQTPLTFDHKTIQSSIAEASVGLAGQTTSIGDAIGLAVRHFLRTPQKGRVLILLTDGANTSGVLDPIKAARMAQAEHVKIYTIGLEPMLDPHSLSGMFMQMNNAADLDEALLQKIAKITRGRYFRASDPASLQAIYARINQEEPIDGNTVFVRPQKHYYPWFAAAGVLFLLLWRMFVR